MSSSFPAVVFCYSAAEYLVSWKAVKASTPGRFVKRAQCRSPCRSSIFSVSSSEFDFHREIQCDCTYLVLMMFCIAVHLSPK